MGEQVARIVGVLALPVTNQALADLALQADQERRAALQLGDKKRAEELLAERDALLDLIN